MGTTMGEPWAKADLFFLEDALNRCMSAKEVAGFLRRTDDEVRAKASELGETTMGRVEQYLKSAQEYESWARSAQTE